MSAEFKTLQEIVKRARAQLPRGEWDFVIGAAETETSMKRNRLAFERLALKARVLNDVSAINLRRKLLGTDLRIPVLLAPIGSLQGFEKGGVSGAGGIGAEMAVGMAVAQQMLNQPGGISAQTTPAAGVPAAAAAVADVPSMLTPAQAAELLAVSEADVIASLEAGDLKGRKIGTQWRLTRAQIAAIGVDAGVRRMADKAVARGLLAR